MQLDGNVTRVLVADPHPVVRIGLKCLFQQADDICMVAEAGSGVEALHLVEQTKPDVLLLEMNLLGLSAVTITQRLKAMHSSVQVLGFSGEEDAHAIHALLRSGAAGYLTKDEAPEMILTAVRRIAGGEGTWLSGRAAIQLNKLLLNKVALNELSQRQQQVLQLATRGHTNRQIAWTLGIHVKTVEKQLHQLMEKLGVISRVTLAVEAVQRGWIPFASSSRAAFGRLSPATSLGETHVQAFSGTLGG
jgi:DNA-binding NarL/FixJ family response regulator